MNSEMLKGLISVDEAGLRTVREVVAVAEKIGATPAQVALAWLRYRPVPVIPIIGARKLTQLQDNLRSLEVALSPELLRRLDGASAVPLGFPGDMFEQPLVRTLNFGGMRDRIFA